MATREFFCCLLALTTWLLGAHAHAQTVSIQYEANDLHDTVVGRDLWRYVYHLTGSFATFTSFNVLFDPFDAPPLPLYGSLEGLPAAPNADWTVLTSQPIPSLPAAGQYTAIALQDNASLADLFPVSFVWLGTGTPGSQPFEVLDNNFNVIASGSTAPFGTPAIPEPGSLLLVAGALGWLGWRSLRC